jgi:hypothetical protein
VLTVRCKSRDTKQKTVAVTWAGWRCVCTRAADKGQAVAESDGVLKVEPQPC